MTSNEKNRYVGFGVRELLVRCGLAGAIAAAALPMTLATGGAAQDKPADQPDEKKQDKPANPAPTPTPTPQAPSASPAPTPPPPGPVGTDPNSLEAIRKRVREAAERSGVDVKKAEEESKGQGTPPVVQQPAPTPQPPVIPPKPANGKPMPPVGTIPQVRPAAPTGAGAMPPSVPLPGAGAPGAAPGGVFGGAPQPPIPTVGPDEFLFNFTDAVDLTLLVNFIRDELGLQIIAMDGGLKGQTVILTAPIKIKKDQVLPFLVSLLEEKEYTMVEDFAGVYRVEPKNAVKAGFGAGGAFSTTRLIQTPNIKPSSLQQAITTVLNTNRGSAPASQPVFMDDLGLIMLTDSPAMTKLVEDLVAHIVAERADVKFTRFELQNISAPAAKDRVLELLGIQGQKVATGGGPGQPVPVPAAPGVTGSVTNIAERITIDPTANALYLRGREDERAYLEELVRIVDVPNGMLTKWYPVGTATSEAVASAGKGEQLGGISTFEGSTSRSGGGGGRGIVGAGAGGTGQGTEITGAGFILYPDAGGFMYRGTEVQHHRVEQLVANLKDISAKEVVTYEFYKLKHGKAADVAGIIQNLLSNTVQSGNRGGLLGNRTQRNANQNQPGQPRPPAGSAAAAAAAANPGAAGAAGDVGGLGEINGEDVFVLADEANNQVVVKAPAKLQPQFKQLINRIDLRRPQVYIDAKIVAITDNNDWRLAVEAQQIIGQFAFNTNFGLSTLTSSTTSGSGNNATTTTTGGLQSPKVVNPNLSGLTAALIRSKDVPIVITALAHSNDTRIVATPQLLVDDNEEAEVSSVDEQPTSTSSQSGAAGSTISGFGGYQEAGPKLKVKPQISDGGYLRMEYEIELSSFQGSATADLPPPKLTNKIKSASVTVPSDATIVVGGLTLDQTSVTVVKIPLLGDIPIVGNLFKDQTHSKRRITLYVFITPRVMRDPSFADLRLITKQPLVESKLAGEFPPPLAERIDIIDTAKFDTKKKAEEEAEKNKTAEPESPAKTPVRRADPKAGSSGGY